MLHDVGKSHPFFTINYKDPSKEIFKFCMRILQFIFFTQSCDKAEMRVGTSSLNLSFHVMTYINKGVPLKGY